MATLFRFYDRLLTRYPLITSSVQTGILMATGDLVAQTIVERKPLNKINLVRTTEFGAMGLLFTGPALTAWYRYLAKRFGSSSLPVVLKKVACDQFIYAPCFLVAFLLGLGVIQGKNWEVNVAEFKANYTDVLLSNYKVWPWVQISNFYITPVRYQVLVVQIFAIFWNAYVSWKTQTAVKEVTLASNDDI